MVAWTASAILALALALALAACAPAPPGRPLYTPIPESLHDQTVQAPAIREQVAVRVVLLTDGAETDAWTFVSPVDSTASEARTAKGQERTATVRVEAFDESRRGYPYELRLDAGEDLILADRGVVPAGQTVRVEGEDSLVAEMVIQTL